MVGVNLIFFVGGDHEGVNVNLLMPLVRKAELSRSEIQILIELLLNKQQGPAVVNSEWIEVCLSYLLILFSKGVTSPVYHDMR